MLEKTQIWREHESAACLIHLWRTLDSSIMCQAAKGSNCPLLENSIRCPLTQFDDDCPLAEDVEKQLNVAFAMMKAAHCCFGCRSPTGEFADAHCWWQMPTGWWRCPLATSLMLSRLSVWQPLVNFIDIFPPLSAERRDNLLQITLNSPLLGVGVFHWCTPPFNCTRVPSSFLWLAAICVSEFCCKTYTIVLLLTTIPKDQSMHKWSLIWQVGLVCIISLMNDSSCHNGDKDGDQNTDLPDDRFFDNEGISICLLLSHGLLMLFDQ